MTTHPEQFGNRTPIVLKTRIFPNDKSSNPSSLTVVNNTLYFIADDSIHGPELWKSDGTAAGTILAKDILPGSNGSNLFNLTNINGTLYLMLPSFLNLLGASITWEVWRSDGTPTGTSPIATVAYALKYLGTTNGNFYFITRFNPTNLNLVKVNINGGKV